MDMDRIEEEGRRAGEQPGVQRARTREENQRIIERFKARYDQGSGNATGDGEAGTPAEGQVAHAPPAYTPY